MEGLNVNEVIQLNPETTKNPMFAGCFLVITDKKNWGVQGYVQSLGQGGQPGGAAYYRATWEEVVKLNPDASAPFVLAD